MTRLQARGEAEGAVLLPLKGDVEWVFEPDDEVALDGVLTVTASVSILQQGRTHSWREGSSCQALSALLPNKRVV